MLAVMILFAQFSFDQPPMRSERPPRSETKMHAERPSRLDPRARAPRGGLHRPHWRCGSPAGGVLRRCRCYRPQRLLSDVGKKLAASHRRDARQLPSPVDLLKTIRKKEHGMRSPSGHSTTRALGDPDAFQAFLLEPLEYVMELKTYRPVPRRPGPAGFPACQHGRRWLATVHR